MLKYAWYNKDLKAELARLEQQIIEENQAIENVKEEIVKRESDNEKVLDNLDQKIGLVKKETHEMKADYNHKIDAARKKHNNIKDQKVKINSQLQWYSAQNKLRYFYPVKVNNTKEKLEQGKDELEVYQHIIDNLYSVMTDRIEQNHEKHNLVKQLNKHVGEEIDEILSEEKVYFECDNKDKLKVPPFTKVQRIPRDYTKEERVQR